VRVGTRTLTRGQAGHAGLVLAVMRAGASGMSLPSALKAGGKLKIYTRHFSIQLMNNWIIRSALSVPLPCIRPGWKEKTSRVLRGHVFPV